MKYHPTPKSYTYKGEVRQMRPREDRTEGYKMKYHPTPKSYTYQGKIKRSARARETEVEP